MARRRSFANISRIASGRWQVKYTGPDGVRRYAPHTFARREDAETFVGVTRREIDRGRWSGDAPAPTMFGVYAARWLANRQVSGRPRSSPAPSSTTRASWTPICCRSSGTGSCPRSSPRTCGTGTSGP